MKSIYWIDRLLSEKKLPSDRQAALMLGMTTPSMSAHRSGKAVTLDDKYAYRLEELLGLPHGKIVLDQHAEREKDPNISAMWRKFATSAAVIALTILGAAKSDQALADSTHKLLINGSLVRAQQTEPNKIKGLALLTLRLSKLIEHGMNVTCRRLQMLARKVCIPQYHIHTCPTA